MSNDATEAQVRQALGLPEQPTEAELKAKEEAERVVPNLVTADFESPAMKDRKQREEAAAGEGAKAKDGDEGVKTDGDDKSGDNQDDKSGDKSGANKSGDGDNAGRTPYGRNEDGTPYYKQARGAKRMDSQARINDLSARMRMIQEDSTASVAAKDKQIAELTAELNTIKAGGKTATSPATTVTTTATDDDPDAKPGVRPTEEDTNADGTLKYQDWKAWYEADRQFTLDEAARLGRLAAKQERVSQQRNAEQARLQASFQSRLDVVRKVHPDVDRVFQEAQASNFQAPGWQVEAIMESAQNADVMLHLAKNTAERDALVKLPPHQFYRRLVELEKLADVTAKPARKADADPDDEDDDEGDDDDAATRRPAPGTVVRATSRSPEPPARVATGTNTGAKTLADLAKSDPAEYRKVRRQQRQAAGL